MLQTEMRSLKSIPIKPAPKLPDDVVKVCQQISKAGFRAWLAGGCVRDMLLNRTPRDWDVVTNASMERLKEIFPNSLDVGAAFGVLKMPAKAADTQVDIAIFRKEGAYSDRRHPDKVEPGDEKTDSERRDFTVNALYFDPDKAEIVDFVGGHKDLDGKVLRAVGAPEKRFNEDALRILRAARFNAQLGFKLEKGTAAALKKCASNLKEISRERIRDEVFRLLSSTRPILGLETLAMYGMWEPVFGVR